MAYNNRLSNNQISHLLRSVAAVYALKGEKFTFQSIAYQRAADAVDHVTSEMASLWEEGKLQAIPGVGPSIAKHLDELFKNGRSKHFDELLSSYPQATFELMHVPGVGARTAIKLSKVLGISRAKGAIDRLEKAAKKGRIRTIEGFGEDSELKILKAISEIKSRERRMLLPYAAEVADDLINWLRANAKVVRAEPLGSLRRGVATVGDIDIAVSTNDPKSVIKHFTQYPKKQRVVEVGPVTASILLGSEIQVDLYTQPPASFGSLLQHLTGSKHHNIALRTYASKIGYSLSEYGIAKLLRGQKIDAQGKTQGLQKHQEGKLSRFETEEEFYQFLKMDWIPPEMREDKGEIKAALEHKLPSLVSIGDIRGDLQIHSDFPIEPSHDLGIDSMESILTEANALGYEYLAFTEHNPSVSGHTPAQIVDLVKRKEEKVEQINYSRVKGYEKRVKRVFNSLEIDIKPDGTLGLPEKAYEHIDFALVSIHSSFNMGRDTMTKRVLEGLSHPKVKILAHPSARKLNEREGIDVDWEAIFEYCVKNNKWLEIDAEPARLDLSDSLVFEAGKRGVKFSMGTDSHNKEMLKGMKYGVTVARRGWITADQVINTLTLDQILPLLPLS